MSQLFEFVSTDPPPVLLDDAKNFMKVSNKADDKIIQNIINAVASYAEIYTGRTFRIQSWKLLLDEFTDRIAICKNVKTITSIQYTVATLLTTVAASVYYLKKTQQGAEVLLGIDQKWPSDGDETEQGIVITFKTGMYGNDPYEIRSAMLRHINHLYMNRGDCDDKDAAKQSGAEKIYDHFRVPRI